MALMDERRPAIEVPAPPYTVDRFDGHTRPSPDTEWLLPLGNGGFAMGTASLVNRRKYHGLLVASTNPPVERLSVLAGLDLRVRAGNGAEIELFTHRLADGTLVGRGAGALVRMEKRSTRCLWRFRADGFEISKELAVGWKRNACAVRYTVGALAMPLRLSLTPRVALRDFHVTLSENEVSRYAADAGARSVRVTRDGRTVRIECSAGAFRPSPRISDAVLLDFESERHQDDTERVLLPGQFVLDIPPGEDPFVFTVGAALEPEPVDLALMDRDDRGAHLARVRESFTRLHPRGAALTPLVDAADDFLADRIVDGERLTTVIAGFPWFADWGRDTMISMVGLMIASGRHDDARSCLRAFARYVDQGMIPNHFDDYGGPPHYNTVDASLWFIHACSEYGRASADEATYRELLLPACMEVIERYRTGTRFGIRMDPADGLIMAGDETTQLTWMDAKRDGVVFTPRHGKPVEISALWHHGLVLVSEALRRSDAGKSRDLAALAARVGESFRRLFVDEKAGRLHDCLQPDGRGGWKPVSQVRPNQVFAAALEHSPLTLAQRRMVVADARRRFLTPVGLRTLDAGDPGYEARFDGDMMSRDRAYHNGTVWPWLLGAYGEAVLRAGEFSTEARAEVLRSVGALIGSLSRNCLGQIGEVYDAEPDAQGVRREQACVAQAWSVAEPLRVALMALE